MKDRALDVDQCFREFRSGRRPFASLMEALRSIETAGVEGRAAIEACLDELVDLSAFPNDLAMTIRASLDMAKSSNPDDLLDPPTRLRSPGRSQGGASDDVPSPRRPTASPFALGPADFASRSADKSTPPPLDPLREKIDEVVLSALTSDFRGLRRGGGESPRGGERSSDRQLDAALATFRGARLRRDATKSSEGAARPFDFAALAPSGQTIAIGTILKNRFVLDREIGRGGMGVVYRAVDRRRLEAMRKQPYVAVKLLPSISNDPEMVKRLLFEAPQKSQQAWFIRQFGPEVNLGNIPPDEVIPLETLRLGLRSDTMSALLLNV